MVLCTLPSSDREFAEKKLFSLGIPFVVSRINREKVNIFFGDRECIQIVKSFGDKPLNDYTDEQDFILGVMLGYSRKLQCRRYLSRKTKTNSMKMVPSERV
jgi:hypothetical protein